MSNIYQISREFLQLAEALTESGGEILPEVETALAINKEELQTKAINYGYVIKSIDSDISTIDEEIDRLNSLKKAKNNALNRLKNTVIDAMILFDIHKVETPTLKLSLRESKSVEILDEEEIEARFIKTKEVKTVDKAGLKKAIESGELVSGAVLKTNQNLNIK